MTLATYTLVTALFQVDQSLSSAPNSRLPLPLVVDPHNLDHLRNMDRILWPDGLYANPLSPYTVDHWIGWKRTLNYLLVVINLQILDERGNLTVFKNIAICSDYNSSS